MSMSLHPMTPLDAVLVDGARKLAAVADQSGADSALYRLCADLWRRYQGHASASVKYGDSANALVVLGRAVDILALAPAILARNELTLDEVELLLQAA